MNAAALLVRRYALDPVSADFIAESCQIFSGHHQVDAAEAVSGTALERPVALSTFGKAQAFVGDRKLSNEELCIVAAFCGTDFECDGRHDHLPLFVAIISQWAIGRREERRQRKWEMVFRVVVIR